MSGITRARCWRSARPATSRSMIYKDEFLIERPMLAALRAPEEAVLLIDEIDRSDHEFEAFLLEFLSDFQISIPERGTLRAHERPVVILTSNRTRELHEALRRRCVYHWIDYPTPDREARIVMMRASSVAEHTARAVVAAVGRLRREPLTKPPGVAEAVDWAEAATLLHQRGARWPDAFKRAIGVALKDEEDLTYVRAGSTRSSRRRQRERASPCGAAFLEFPALLRANGFAVAPEQTATFLEAVGLLGPRSVADIRRAAHATLAPSRTGAPHSMRCSECTFLAKWKKARRSASPRTKRRIQEERAGGAAAARLRRRQRSRSGGDHRRGASVRRLGPRAIMRCRAASPGDAPRICRPGYRRMRARRGESLRYTPHLARSRPQ